PGAAALRTHARVPGLRDQTGDSCSASDGEAEGSHLVASVVGDALRAPRRHPHPVDAELLDDAIERLRGLLLEHIRPRATGARQRHVDDESIVLVIPREVVDETQVDHVDPEFGIHDVLERLGDLVVLLGREGGGHTAYPNTVQPSRGAPSGRYAA